MTVAENKRIALSFFDKLSEGNLEGALALLDDGVVWRVAGQPDQFPLAGKYDKGQFVEMLSRVGVAMPDGVRVTITGSVADEDRVAVEAEVHGVSAAGKVYDNRLVYVLDVREGKIHNGREYLDTMHANEVLVVH